MTIIHPIKLTTEGSCLKGYIKLSPKLLATICTNLGAEILPGDDYKVSRTYQFLADGEIVTVYDWKNTWLYDSDYPTPDQFWESYKEFTFSIGAHSEKAANLVYNYLINETEK